MNRVVSPQGRDESRPYEALTEMEKLSPPSLARKDVVRENKEEVSQETLEQKVRRDPVVQEIMRTFTARIVDIHPK